MKKIVFLGTALAALVSLNSCKDKTTTTPAPTVVQELYPSPTIKIGYTIHVISNGATSKTAGLTGATVTVKQNGQTYTGTTDESGMVTFANLTEGYITYFVKLQISQVSTDLTFYHMKVLLMWMEQMVTLLQVAQLT